MASLTDLPVEALVIIFNCLRPRQEAYDIHMRKPSLNARDLSIRRELQKQANHLVNLCSTCKLFRLVAQPIAYQSIFNYNYINWGQSLSTFLYRFGSLTKTLSERPDLAANVKFLDIHMLDRFEDDERMPTNATDEQKLAVSRLSSRVGLKINITEDWLDWDIAEAYFQILMVLLPNLSHTNVCLPGSWKLESLSAWAARTGAGVGLARPFLANVRHMELEHRVADLNSRYERSDYETHDDEIEHILSSVERLFLEAAPNIELLCCSAGGLDSLPRLDRLDTLQIMMKGSWDGILPKVMMGFPRMRRFSYKSTTDYCPSPKQVREALESHKHTLEYLDMSLQRCVWWPSWRPKSQRDYEAFSFADFTSLKTLNLDASDVWPKTLYDGRGEKQSDSGLLPDLLPASLVEIHVDGFLPHGDESFKSLAEAIASGRLPNLTCVFWRAGTHMQVIDQETAKGVYNPETR
ncbi:hypothetical protein CGMCC3_g267 [Colletotrichum fructicola]|uniref:F-box domain-containing protein n=1 Tax=Colletotrichum fructicola (strain Nara gc5) TaxID=1213859 RepID=A0A7J6J9Q5_COLFN|nr:uncharacterized protein CGMCC3_g267 [Colletotrichum fructicola]KAE9583780.1 hypothetical protein CGMCC3_g267 [Colletotrichum fructicola]KAF4486473.1 hypothetical protein CGGC5_v004888 [Colletotrichum fructicola Nara gc5]